MKKYKTFKFINVNGKYKAYNTEQNLIDILNKEIDRLNLGYRYLEKYHQERQDYEYAELVRQVKTANIEWLENAIKYYE